MILLGVQCNGVGHKVKFTSIFGFGIFILIGVYLCESARFESVWFICLMLTLNGTE